MKPYGCAADTGALPGPLSPDRTRATTFAHPDAETLRAVGAGAATGEFYPRYGHPAGRAFESRIAALEGTDGAVSFASGMAALHGALGALLSSGDKVAAQRELYGGTTALLERDLARFGIDIVRFDKGDHEALRAAAAGATIVLVESPTNPLCGIVDLKAVAAIAREQGAVSIVDATFAPPPLQRPHALGIDIVMHSATKFLGGHHDCLGGVASANHAHCTAIERFRRHTGGVLGPDTAWLLLRSLKTLDLRVQQACVTAAQLARFLQNRTVAVHYPGLASHPDHDLAGKQMTGFGAVLAFEVAGGLPGAMAVYDRFRLIARAVSLGGADTTALLPRDASHAMLSAEERARAGIADGLIRIAVGLEPVEELEADLAQALAG